MRGGMLSFTDLVQRITILILLLSSTLPSQGLYSQTSVIQTDKIIQLTYNCQFEEALKIIDQGSSQNSNTLMREFAKSIVIFRSAKYHELFSRNKEERNKVEHLYEEAYNSLIKTTSLGEEILKKNPDDTLALFITGAAYGYIGIYHIKKDEMYSAVKEGKKGMDYHDRLIKLCPEWIDVYLSQGIYNLYASNAPWYIKPFMWIFGRSADEKIAYRNLNLVAGKGEVAKYEAAEYLMEYFIERKKYNLVTDLYKKLTAKLPQSIYYYTLKIGFYSLQNSDYDYFITAIEDIASKYKKEKPNEINKRQMGILYIVAANYYMNMKNYTKAGEYWNRVINGGYLKEEEPWLYTVLANNYLQENNKKEAIRCYNWVIDHSNNQKYIKEAKDRLNDLNPGS